jgi:hypothetical protein
MRRSYPILLALCAQGATAQDLLDALPADVRAAFLPGNMTIERALPDRFGGIAALPGLEFVASSTRHGGVTAAFQVTSSRAIAYPAVVGELERTGWLRLGGPNERGFQFGDATMSTLCKENENATAYTQQAGSTTLILVRIRPSSSPCAPPPQTDPSVIAPGIGPGLRSLPIDDRMSIERMSIERYAPTLFGPIGSTGGGRQVTPLHDRRSAITVLSSTSDLAADKLEEIFAAQLSEQSWRPESRWSNGSVAGSTWSLQPETGPRIVGLLDVVTREGSEYQATFRLVSMEARSE